MGVACAKPQSSDSSTPLGSESTGGGSDTTSTDDSGAAEGGDDAGDESSSALPTGSTSGDADPPSSSSGGSSTVLSTTGGGQSDGTGGTNASGAAGDSSVGSTGGASSSASATIDCSGGCQSSKQCDSADVIGSVSGDTDTSMNQQSAMGCGSQWLSVRVTNDRHLPASVIGRAMRLTATLTPPAGQSFEIYLYVDPKADNPACAQPVANGTSASVMWGPHDFYPELLPHKDNSRTVNIEVRAAAGTMCSTSATWSLTVTGNMALPNTPHL